jgi:hypothetical protein
VQDVPTPPLAKARHVGQDVDEPRREKQATCRELLPRPEPHRELPPRARDGADPSRPDTAAVLLHLGAAGREELRRWRSFPPGIAVDMARRSVAWVPVVDHQDRTSSAGQGEGGAQAGGTAADHDRVK